MCRPVASSPPFRATRKNLRAHHVFQLGTYSGYLQASRTLTIPNLSSQEKPDQIRSGLILQLHVVLTTMNPVIPNTRAKPASSDLIRTIIIAKLAKSGIHVSRQRSFLDQPYLPFNTPDTFWKAVMTHDTTRYKICRMNHICQLL